LYDPVTETSTDSFCPTCSGVYYIPVYSGTSIQGHVTWAYSEQLGWPTGGKQFEGDVRIQIKYTEANLSAVDNAKWVEVDGRQMEVKKRTLRGVQSINRILVDLLEKEKL
jgi:ribosomal protein S8